MKVKKLTKVLDFIDPLFIYIVGIYGLSQVYQRIYGVESVWQNFWDRIQEVLGEWIIEFPR